MFPLNAKLGVATTLKDTEVAALKVPEVPVTVKFAGPPIAAVLEAVSVSTCVPATVPAAKLAVTPAGSPFAARATAPLNPPSDVTVIVLVALLVWATDSVAGAATSVKLGGTLTVREMMVELVKVPAVPVTVNGTGPPAAAAPPALSVRVVEAVAGFVENAAVTPLGKPVAAKVTPPLKPFAPVIVMESVTLVP